MPKATNLAAYPTENEVLLRALESPRGVRVKFKTKKEATLFRFNCYHVRAIYRKESMELHNPGDPEYNKSPFDHLRLTISHNEENDVWTLEISPAEISIENIEIEEL